MPEESFFSYLPPLSLYIHFPWCMSKCPYCDFNSHALDPRQVPVDRYIQALLDDLCFRLPDIWQRRCYSIFMGGGTPSLFPPESIAKLLSSIRSLIPLDPYAEITMEANPGSLECGQLSGYREAGITRLSLGVQSFQTAALHALGRLHTPEEALEHAEQVIRLFPRHNLDLMYALPGQTLETLEQDIALVRTLQPGHLSYYHLTIEANTAFAAQPPQQLPNHDLSADMHSHIESAFGDYEHYEISAYAREGHCCQHNLNYWSYGDFIGIGAGAASKISCPKGYILRSMNVKHPKHFLSTVGSPQVFTEHRQLSIPDIIFEYALNAFRLRAGFTLQDFSERTGLSLLSIMPTLDKAEALGLIHYPKQNHVQTTAQGWSFLNELLSLFLPEPISKKNNTTITIVPK